MTRSPNSSESLANPTLWPYALEKLSEAVTILATHPEEVRRRLFFAFKPLSQVPHSALPPNLSSQYAAIMRALLRKAPPNPGLSVVNWNLHRMHKSTGTKIAKQIVRLQGELAYLYRGTA